VSLSLQTDRVSHRFGEVQALRGVTLLVPAGSVTALVGESGSGKTTLLRCFNRLVQPDAGSVHLGSDDVGTLDPVQLRRRIGYVPQNGGLLPHWTVARNVALVPRLLRLPDAGRAAQEALEHVGLPAAVFGDRLPHELSGGQRQRVALARALAARQQVMLLDEAFSALDAISRSDAHEVFERVRRDIGFTAVLVTHDLAEAARLADCIAVMHQGAIEQAGTIADLRRSPHTPYVRSLVERAAAANAALGAR
jgi:osmoprotectant transport system ATP-binding protein